MLTIILTIENDEERLAAENIWNRYKEKMYLLAYEVLNDRRDAEDAVMEAVTRIVRNIRKFLGLSETDLICLITIYVKNAAIDIYNHNKMHSEFEAGGEYRNLTGENHNTEDRVPEKQDPDLLTQQLQSLSEMYSYPLILRYHYEYSIKDISDTLQLNYFTVKQRLYRAKKLLRERMEQSSAQ